MQDIIARSEEVHDEMTKGDERRETAAKKEKETPESVRKTIHGEDTIDETKRESNGVFERKNGNELKLRLGEIEIKRRKIEIKEKGKERESGKCKKDQEMKKRECEARETEML